MIKLTINEIIDKKGWSRYELSKRTGVQYQVIDKYYKNNVIRYDKYVIDKICRALECEVGDILKFVDEEE